MTGRVAIVTGAGGGIGGGIARLLAAEGAAVVVNDRGASVRGEGRDQRAADAVVESIRAAGGQALANYGDVSSWDEAEEMVRAAVDAFGRLDVLVNNAGILRDRMIFNLTEQDWDAVIAVHLKGAFNCTRHACAQMRRQRAGRIVSMSSTSGLYGNAGQANYGAAKDGIAGLTRVVSREMGKYGVTVNAIAPAAATRMIATIPGQGGEGSPSLPDPEDVAPFVVYLATDAAAGINGQTFLVTGGMVAHLPDPAPVRTIQTTGRWTAREIARVFPSTLGLDLVNPAPVSKRSTGD